MQAERLGVSRRTVERYRAEKLTTPQKRIQTALVKEIATEALKEVYLQDGGRRAGSLEEVRFTDIEHLEFEL